jgi:serine protease Do
VKVMLNNLKDVESLSMTRGPRGGAMTFNNNGNTMLFRSDESRAMLGVTTNDDEKGARVTDVTKESAAEKIGLKEDDIITKINDQEIKNPDDLSEAISKHKPGEKVTVHWLRDKKEQKATAELTKWKGMSTFGSTSPLVREFRMESDGKSPAFPNMRELQELNQFKVFEAPMGQNWSWSGNGPKLGLSVQDTDDGKGVKVIEVDQESNAAKAGLKEEDLITEIDGKAVNSTDETVKIIKESKEKTSIMVKLSRGGKTINIEVKMPRKIKTADL